MNTLGIIAFVTFGVLALRRTLRIQTYTELGIWFAVGVVRSFISNAAIAGCLRIWRGGKAVYENWSWTEEMCNAGAQGAAQFLQMSASENEVHYQFMRKGFELIASQSTKTMEDAGFAIFDYNAGNIRCRAMCPKHLVPRVKAQLGLVVSANEEQEALVWSMKLLNDRGIKKHVLQSQPIKWLMHFHGGGYVSGTLLASQAVGHHYGEHALSRKSAMNLVVVLPEYALAPEARFPAAVLDGLDAYVWHTLRPDISPENIVLAGESAGGGLVAAMLLAIRDTPAPYLEHFENLSGFTKKDGLSLRWPLSSFHMPAGAVLMSPLLDLRHDALYCEERAPFDIITAASVNGAAKTYVPSEKVAANNPLASPILGTLSGMPPLLLSAGEVEIFKPSIRSYYLKAKSQNPADADISFHNFPGQTHSFQLQWSSVDSQAGVLYDEILNFVQRSTTNSLTI